MHAPSSGAYANMSDQPGGDDDRRSSPALYSLLKLDPQTHRSRYDDAAVRAAVVADPSSVSRRYPFRLGYKRVQLYPLAMAICLGASLETVDLIYRSHPDAVAERDDKYGNTPLHWACRFKASVPVLRLLANEYPAALTELSTYGWTPLRVACAFGASVDVISTLVDACPDALRIRGKAGRAPLHLACESGAPVEVVRTLADSCPEALGWTDKEGRTPLHAACEYGASADVIERLIESRPEALREGDKTGNTPLHRACARKAPVSVLRSMLKYNPSLAVQTNRSGEIPLSLLWDALTEREMYACIRGIRDSDYDSDESQGHEFRHEVSSLRERIYLLLRAGHHGTVDDPLPPTDDGVARRFRLLHAACGVRCPRLLLNLVLAEHGDEAGEKDEEGNTALGLAVRSMGRYGGGGVAKAGGDGTLTNNAAAAAAGNDRHHDSQARMLYAKNVAASLLNLCPRAAYVRDPQGRFPLHVALHGGMTWHDGAVAELARAGPEVVTVRDMATRMYPYQMAAAYGRDVDTVLELLEREPYLVRDGTDQEEDRDRTLVRFFWPWDRRNAGMDENHCNVS